MSPTAYFYLQKNGQEKRTSYPPPPQPPSTHTALGLEGFFEGRGTSLSQGVEMFKYLSGLGSGL